MGTNNPRLAPGPDCGRYAAALPLLEVGELDSATSQATRAHLATCAWCQRKLASYATVEAAIRRHFDLSGPSGSITTMEEIMRRSESGHAASRLTTTTPRNAPPPQPRRRMRVLSGAAAVAAVLVIAVLAAVLFGSQRGQSGATSGPVTLSPALANKTVYVTTGDGVYALRASNGTVRWSYSIPGANSIERYGLVALAGDVLFVALPQGSRGAPIVALNVADGTVRSIFYISNLPAGDIVLAVDSGVIYATSDLPLAVFGDKPIPDWKHMVYALRASDGQEIWRYHADEPIISTPTVAHGVVYVGTTGAVYALRAGDGTPLWRSILGVSASPQGATESIDGVGITAASDFVYVSAIISSTNDRSSRFGLWMLRASDGEHLLSTSDVPSNGQLLCCFVRAFPPVVANGLVYTQQIGGIVAYAADLSDHLPKHSYSSPGSFAVALGFVVADDGVYATGYDGYLYAFRASDARLLWRVQLQRGVIDLTHVTPPAVSDGTIFVAEGSTLYALRSTDGAMGWHVDIRQAIPAALIVA